MLDTQRVVPTETLAQTRYPLEWRAAHYGWETDTGDEGLADAAQPGGSDGGYEMYEEGEEEEMAEGSESSDSEPRPSSHRGGRRDPAADPPVDDEAKT